MADHTIGSHEEPETITIHLDAKLYPDLDFSKFKVGDMAKFEMTGRIKQISSEFGESTDKGAIPFPTRIIFKVDAIKDLSPPSGADTTGRAMR